MRLRPENIEIPVEKITAYLLVEKDKNDKSAFLANLGYTINNWADLVADIKKIVLTNDAHLQQSTLFGDIFEVKGTLKNKSVVTIWLLAIDAQHYRFVTLFPDK